MLSTVPMPITISGILRIHSIPNNRVPVKISHCVIVNITENSGRKEVKDGLYYSPSYEHRDICPVMRTNGRYHLSLQLDDVWFLKFHLGSGEIKQNRGMLGNNLTLC